MQLKRRVLNTVTTGPPSLQIRSCNFQRQFLAKTVKLSNSKGMQAIQTSEKNFVLPEISINVSSSTGYDDVVAPIPQKLFTTFEKEENGSTVVALVKNATMGNNPIAVRQSIVSAAEAIDEIDGAADWSCGRCCPFFPRNWCG
ncbi:hypothetical protein ACH5RR_006659 [Cinchona calisaya]|uniref:Uncharacterized protein n=1 Tax=Cinchona calisaya TaxID=153742 RepID=A0ABD3APL6_9GENT